MRRDNGCGGIALVFFGGFFSLFGAERLEFKFLRREIPRMESYLGIMFDLMV